MIQGMFDSGSMPVLERLVQFSGQRHRLLVNDIANLSTPNFRPADLSVSSFQAELARAIGERDSSPAGSNGKLELHDTEELHFEEEGIVARPGQEARNILFHDRNNRSLEVLMKDLAENTMIHNAALEMLKNQFGVLTSAIRGTV